MISRWIKCALAIILAALIAHPVAAQGTKVPKNASKTPMMTYKAVVKPDGTIDLQPVKPDLQILDQSKSMAKDFLKYKPVPWGSTKFDAMFKDQKVLTQINSQGQLKAVFAFPKGSSVPSAVVESMVPGDTLVVAGYGTSWLVNAEETVRQTVISLLNKARLTACSLDPRPVQFGAAAQVGASLGFSGSFTFNAVWNTADLCK